MWTSMDWIQTCLHSALTRTSALVDLRIRISTTAKAGACALFDLYWLRAIVLLLSKLADEFDCSPLSWRCFNQITEVAILVWNRTPSGSLTTETMNLLATVSNLQKFTYPSNLNFQITFFQDNLVGLENVWVTPPLTPPEHACNKFCMPPEHYDSRGFN